MRTCEHLSLITGGPTTANDARIEDDFDPPRIATAVRAPRTGEGNWSGAMLTDLREGGECTARAINIMVLVLVL